MARFSPLRIRFASLGESLKHSRYPSSKNHPTRRPRLEPLEDRLLLAFDPTGMEQEMLEHVNRMRMDPQGELDVLFTSLSPLDSPDPAVDTAINYFGDPTSEELQSEWASLAPAAPVAWHESLYDAALGHNQEMIAQDAQSHQLPGEASLSSRLTSAGYTNWSTIGENVYAYSASVFYAHSGFAIDWGVPSRGHRNNMMNAVFREVGISIVPESSPATNVGPLVVTEDFADRWAFGNPYLLGTVYEDTNTNGRYDAGEGLGGVTIEVSGNSGTFTTTTMTAGGYQLDMPTGTYTVTATGGSLSGPLMATGVFVGSSNVKVDLQPEVNDPPRFTPVANDDAYSVAAGSTLVVSAPGVLGNDTDGDGDPLTATLVTGTMYGTITFYSNGSFAYQSGAGVQGTDSFTYRAEDPLGNSDTATVTITVDSANTAPVAVDDFFRVYIDDTLSVLGDGLIDNDTDADGDSLSAVLVSGPSHGSLSLNSDGTFDYAPAPGYHGLDSFTYCANDGQSDSNPVTVKLCVIDPVGPVDYVVRTDQDPSDTNLCYLIQPVRDGMLTVEAVFDGAQGSAAFTLRDYDDTELAASSPVNDRQRMEFEVDAGGTYVIELAGTNADVDMTFSNLVRISPDGSQMTVFGSDGEDTFEVVVGSPHVVIVNGVRHESSQATVFQILGGGGSDTATVTGSDNDDTATLGDTSATLVHAGYDVRVNEVESITINGGGGNDTVDFTDSAGDDEFVGWPGGATMIKDDAAHSVDGFETIVATAGNGGTNTARLYDSPGDDLFVTVPSYGWLMGDGFSLQATAFHSVNAYAPNGGHDVTRMYDSPGDDVFYATPVETVLYRSGDGDGFFNRAKYFEEVHGFSPAGGYDVGFLFDSAGDDTFYAGPAEGAMYGDTGGGDLGDRSYFNRVNQFEEIRGDAAQGGNDTATLLDSEGSDTLVATPTYAAITADWFAAEATNFPHVEAYATAWEHEGVYDRADLYDSAGDDEFVTTPTYGSLQGTGYFNQAIGFSGVNAYSSTGNDTAKMYDGPGDDTFYALPTEGMIWGPGYYHRAKGFEHVDAFATAGGDDAAHLFDSDADDSFYGSPTESMLYGTGFHNRANLFERVYADASAGGTDQADLFDSDRFDLLEAGGNRARLSNTSLNFLCEVLAFDQVNATATTDGDTRDVTEPIDFILSLAGPWQDL